MFNNYNQPSPPISSPWRKPSEGSSSSGAQKSPRALQDLAGNPVIDKSFVLKNWDNYNLYVTPERDNFKSLSSLGQFISALNNLTVANPFDAYASKRRFKEGDVIDASQAANLAPLEKGVERTAIGMTQVDLKTGTQVPFAMPTNSEHRIRQGKKLTARKAEAMQAFQARFQELLSKTTDDASRNALFALYEKITGKKHSSAPASSAPNMPPAWS